MDIGTIIGIGKTFLDRGSSGEGSAGQLTPLEAFRLAQGCLLYTSPSPRDLSTSRMPSSA